MGTLTEGFKSPNEQDFAAVKIPLQDVISAVM